MAKRVCILSHEATFAQMLRLSMEDGGFSVSVLHREKRLPQADVYIVDRDAFSVTPPATRVIGYGRTPCAQTPFLPRPFAMDELLSLLRQEEGERGLTLAEDGTAAYLDGTRIPLSEREYALLACLMRAQGAPVSREELLREVWGEGQSAGVVNVYLHYLRKKLERGGNKLLYAVRGSGYALRLENGK